MPIYPRVNPLPHCPWRPEAHSKVHPQDSAIEMSALTAILGVVGRAAEAVPAVEMGAAHAPVLGKQKGPCGHTR